MQDPIKILGVPVHAMTMQEAVKTLEERMLAKEQTFVVTANAEIIMMCQAVSYTHLTLPTIA